ncbi:GNAT family N-acetyltransferase [Glycomyces sp. NPDC046736]|uniref:GNAT family N-acetyltransferase n=1 Tax=Glycomyces sp. NPDC046736 TaxID=3155615 RepID=UPI00340100E5
MGELIEIGPGGWRVMPDGVARKGPVGFDESAVVAARVVPPRPTPFSEIIGLERLLAETWPATETADLGGWLLRSARGFTKRANSALALTAPPGGVDEAAAAVKAWYRERGTRPLISLAGPVTKRLDEELAARGWTALGHTVVMTRPIEPVAFEGEAVVLDSPGDDFLAQAGDEDPETAAKVFGSGPDRGYAEIRRGGVLAARGRGALAGDLVAIARIGTAEAFRRRGLGTEVLRALEAWGAANGARRAVLQVEADNESALAMYERLGYAERYRYCYRAL